jgi:hypothetical protein
MSILLQLKTAALSLKGTLFRTALLADMTAIETTVNANESQLNALQAAAAVAVWSSGGSYTIGQVAYSPTNFLNYRNKTGAAGTDPSGDTTNWESMAQTAVEIHGATSKTTPVNADEIGLWDSVSGILRKLTFSNLWVWIAAKIQAQTATAYTAVLTGAEYAATPAPAITAYAANQTFNHIFDSACPNAPTLKLNGIATPPNLVRQNLDGSYENLTPGDFPAGWQSPVKLVSATQALVLVLPRRTKILSFTRDLTAASGDVNYTGFGATPKSIQVIGGVSVTSIVSNGFANQTQLGCTYTSYAGIVAISNFVAAFVTASGNNQTASVPVFSKDTVTLTWTKTASPTGTATLYVRVEY